MNMPKRNGREVIEEMKTDPGLTAIPIVVLTSSNQDQDVLAGYDPKRCLYIVKPTSFQALVELANKIHNFWLSLTSRKPEP
jgi:CheY-like chemotaxis protein